MKQSITVLFLLIGSAFLTSFTEPNWQKDFDTTMSLAKENHKLVLLNFSGSDWCVPCIRMHREIFEDEGFNQLADSVLVMYDADFPQKKKNQLDPDLKLQNEKLAEQYNKTGFFPYTVLMDENGNILKSWTGYPKEGLSGFQKEIREAYQSSLLPIK